MANPSILLSQLLLKAITYQSPVLLPERLLALALLPRTGTADTAMLCLAQDHAQLRARVALLPEHISKLDVLWANEPKLCLKTPQKMLDLEELQKSRLWIGLGTQKLRDRNQPLGSRASSWKASMGLEISWSLNDPCHIRLFSTHPISISPCVCSSVGNMLEIQQNDGYSLDKQLALTCPPTECAWHRERRLELLL